MISKKDLKSHDFASIEDYYQYIIESQINGQINQAIKFIWELSKQQKKQFIDWCNAEKGTGEAAIKYEECIYYTIETI